jgi:hypothetical protein
MADTTLVLKEIQISIAKDHHDTVSIFSVEDGGSKDVQTVLSCTVFLSTLW